MTVAEAFLYVKEQQPRFIHVSGKTSTGKSTFARRLRDGLGYEIIELDAVITETLMKPLNLKDRGQVVSEVYKHRSRQDWITKFTTSAQRTMQRHRDNEQRIVVDGAIANITTLQELLVPFPETEILYFHPDNLETYERYLTSRFMLTRPDYDAGLPIAFWELADDEAFRQFCQDRVLTPVLRKAIRDYAAASQETSKDRFADLQAHFGGILLVTI